jgi:antitoxin (DNA-binding transcriptional repressor) of toxin-antitoxin stability system
MRAIGIKVLKNKLSEYVRRAANGETILVTDRDRVVAELNPPSAGRATTAGSVWFEDAVRKGWIRPALLKGPLPPPPAPIMSLEQLMKQLDEDRGDR